MMQFVRQQAQPDVPEELVFIVESVYLNMPSYTTRSCGAIQFSQSACFATVTQALPRSKIVYGQSMVQDGARMERSNERRVSAGNVC